MKSTCQRLHAAIIMDGNGRWATARGMPRIAGHRAGAEALRRTVEAAPNLGIGTLTIYAFSSDNWQRPGEEVSALMRLFRSYLRNEQAKCIENGIRISVIGRRDRLPRMLLPAIESVEAATAQGSALHLRIAVDYSASSAGMRKRRDPRRVWRRPGWARCRSADPHRRRAAPERLSALGVRLRRTDLHCAHVA